MDRRKEIDDWMESRTVTTQIHWIPEKGQLAVEIDFHCKILHLGPGLGYVTRHKSFCIGMFTMFSCSSQYNSNVFYVLPLFWQKESLNVFVLYIVWEAWRKSDQRNFGKKRKLHTFSLFLLIWGHRQAEALSGFPELFSVQMLYILSIYIVHNFCT